jgi:hypothetical protein
VSYLCYTRPITVDTFGEMSRFTEHFDTSVPGQSQECVSVGISRTGRLQISGHHPGCLWQTRGLWRFWRRRRHLQVVEMIRILVGVHERCVDWIRDNVVYIQQYREFHSLLHVFTQTQTRIVMFVDWYITYTRQLPLDTFLLREIYREHLHMRGVLFKETYHRCKMVWYHTPVCLLRDLPTIYEACGRSALLINTLS